MARSIPNYDLYGDQAGLAWSNSFNFEWIPQRSRLYNWQIQVHRHDAFLQLLYLTEGEGQVTINSARIRAQAPCLILLPAGTAHGFSFTPKVNGPVVTITQKVLESLATLLMPELQSVIRTPRVVALPTDSRHVASLMPIFLELERESRLHASGQTAAGMSLMTALLVLIARIVGTPEKADTRIELPFSSRKTRQIEQFKTLLDQHFREHWSVQAYASIMGLTAGQLSRICREVLGMSSLDLINARLIHEAQRELVYTVGSVKMVAHELGFEDDAYFSRFFKRQTGMSPRDFRAQALRQFDPSPTEAKA
ncbi:helix-turn-helix domain-containing protein [Hydrogenophaga sp.]|uniref:helix-turn-helix domain-containing protein n=1 Tax=Hydrogenophaga sp. TaxID=1904254 RepID=UPI002606D2EB|nr:helix-turn-helix domain-containing protein [Hydrogenophaga sp.]MCW5654646.1 helix-turn-helix domain-containing protein [Hydrogenophaga sp.]